MHLVQLSPDRQSDEKGRTAYNAPASRDIAVLEVASGAHLAYDASSCHATSHTHPGEEVGYVLDGTVTIEFDGTKKALKAGEAFAIPAGKVHNAI